MPVFNFLDEYIQRLPGLLIGKGGVRTGPCNRIEKHSGRHLGDIACLSHRFPAKIQKTLQMHAPPIQGLLRWMQPSPFHHSTHPCLWMRRWDLGRNGTGSVVPGSFLAACRMRLLIVRLHFAMVWDYGNKHHFFLNLRRYLENNVPKQS